MSRTSIWSAFNSRMSAVQARDDRNLKDNLNNNNLTCLCRNVCLHQHINLAMDFYRKRLTVQFSSVQFLSPVRLFAIPRTPACQTSLSIANSQSLLKLIAFESVMPSISSSVVPFSPCLQSFPTSGSFQMSQLFSSDGQSIGVSTSTSIFPMNIQD